MICPDLRLVASVLLLGASSACTPSADQRLGADDIAAPSANDRRLARLLSVGNDPNLLNKSDKYDLALRCKLSLAAFARQASSASVLTDEQRRALDDLRKSFADRATMIGTARGEDQAARQAKEQQVAASMASEVQKMQVAIACLRNQAT